MLGLERKDWAVLQKMGYEIASELNIHEIEDEMQVLSFAEVEEEHMLNRLWIKRLDKAK